MNRIPGLVWCRHHGTVHEEIADPYGQYGEVEGFTGCTAEQEPIYMEGTVDHPAVHTDRTNQADQEALDAFAREISS